MIIPNLTKRVDWCYLLWKCQVNEVGTTFPNSLLYAPPHQLNSMCPERIKNEMRLAIRYIQQERFEILSTDSRKLDNIFAELVQ